MRPQSRWLNNEEWVCLRHAPYLKLPASVERCWYKDCSERPKKVCSFSDCFKHRRDGSKYCSVACKNKNARQRYRKKQKEQG